jgi:hypothetical protein
VALGSPLSNSRRPPCFGKDKEVLECSGRRLLSAPQPKKSVAGSPLITIAATPLVAEFDRATQLSPASIARTGMEQLCSVRRQSRRRDVVEI